MTRTQIQLPDELYHRAKRLAGAKEISLAELTRRGLEHMLEVHPTPPQKGNFPAWKPPTPRKMGWKNLDADELKAAARPEDQEGIPGST